MSKRSERKSEAQVWDWRVPRRIDGPAAPTRASTALVVGFDRHAASRRALEFAIELGAGLRAYLHVAHVVDTEDLPIDPDSDDWEARICEALDREREQACAVLATSAGNWTYHGRAGDPAKVLIALADAHDAAMILIGTPRRDLMARIDRLLGESVSARLVHHSHRPVLLVPHNTVARLGTGSGTGRKPD
ncbi:universal stress protein [Rhodococcus sp. DMF-1]|uniref:universal stress protein n=1 Tax=Rhodococcus sp. DMF-1 TaxID=2907624 RepID=UPI001F18956D|nr:universal stress protein [Rhodococcus sp. DMF-1]UIR35120.1 universal stress protein [Rhodococcus sp. DMF-1]